MAKLYVEGTFGELYTRLLGSLLAQEPGVEIPEPEPPAVLTNRRKFKLLEE